MNDDSQTDSTRHPWQDLSDLQKVRRARASVRERGGGLPDELRRVCHRLIDVGRPEVTYQLLRGVITIEELKRQAMGAGINARGIR